MDMELVQPVMFPAPPMAVSHKGVALRDTEHTMVHAWSRRLVIPGRLVILRPSLALMDILLTPAHASPRRLSIRAAMQAIPAHMDTPPRPMVACLSPAVRVDSATMPVTV